MNTQMDLKNASAFLHVQHATPLKGVQERSDWQPEAVKSRRPNYSNSSNIEQHGTPKWI